MTIREMAEQREEELFSNYASLSKHSRGREREEPQCDIRPVYQRDRDRILHCKSFRRLKHKTQVFCLPQGGSLPNEAHPHSGGGSDSAYDHESAASQ